MDAENTLYLDLKGGRVTIELLPAKAPGHVTRIKELVSQGFYDGLKFHRVIDGFMAQTGDVANGNMEKDFNLRRAGTGGSSASRRSERSCSAWSSRCASSMRAFDLSRSTAA